MGNMGKKRKIGALLACIIAPAMVLCGCGQTVELEKLTSSYNAPNFMAAVAGKLDTFNANLNKKLVAPAVAAVGEGQEGEEIAPVFDFSTYQGDEFAQTIWNTKIWDAVNKVNRENMFALAAYYIYEQNREYNYYDLSFLTDMTENTGALTNFMFTKGSDDGQATRTYTANLTGLEDPRLNLPVPVASDPSLVDAADEVIKQWGNTLAVTVSPLLPVGQRISVKTAFVKPENNKAEELYHDSEIYQEGGLQYVGNDFVLVYTLDDGVTYSKKVSFETQVNGVVKKVVKKYVGNLTVTPDLANMQEYVYTLEAGEGATCDILADYSISYSGNEGGIFCQQKRGTDHVWAEYYVVKSGQILSRVRTSGQGESTTIDMLLNKDLISGSVKYNYRRGSSIQAPFLKDQEVLRNDYCLFTDTEIRLAESSTQANVQILKFDLTEDEFKVSYANKT